MFSGVVAPTRLTTELVLSVELSDLVRDRVKRESGLTGDDLSVTEGFLVESSRGEASDLRVSLLQGQASSD